MRSEGKYLQNMLTLNMITYLFVGRSSQADYLMRNVAMDDSIGGS